MRSKGRGMEGSSFSQYGRQSGFCCAGKVRTTRDWHLGEEEQAVNPLGESSGSSRLLGNVRSSTGKCATVTVKVNTRWEHGCEAEEHTSEEKPTLSMLELQVFPIPRFVLSPVASGKPITREIELLCL